MNVTKYPVHDVTYNVMALFFFRLAKVLDVPFGNHLGIMLMTLVVDNVEKEWLCYAVDLDFIIANVNLLLL